jgi:hypothetical protein
VTYLKVSPTTRVTWWSSDPAGQRIRRIGLTPEAFTSAAGNRYPYHPPIRKDTPMPLRTMPVRKDRWQPTDHVYEGILARSVSDAEALERRDGTAELMAAAVVIAVLAVVIIAVAGSGSAAILVCGLLAAGVFAYVVSTGSTGRGDRGAALQGLGGAGRLPAGYLVHPTAWAAGLAEHVAHIPESQLRAAADMCHLFPGAVDDLLTFVGNIAIHVPPPQTPATPEDVERRAKAMTRIGMPLLHEYVKTAPPLPTPGGKDGKSKGKKK